MAPRPHDALRRAPASVRLPLPRRLPRPSHRSVLVALGCVIAAGVAYALARETPLFAAREVVVAGGSVSARQEVRERLASLGAVSLVAVDSEELANDLEALPAVQEASVDRAFPHTLSVTIEEERPLAVLRNGKRAMLVSVRGRAIREVAPRSLRRVPRMVVDDLSALDAGEAVAAQHIVRALQALAHVPRRFPVRVLSAQATEEGIALTLAGGVELRLGDATALGEKIAAAGAVLRSLSVEERTTLAYVDATLPNRVVASHNPQVEG
jgi:cell division protein FtsQ